jgi:hypothetical protein
MPGSNGAGRGKMQMAITSVAIDFLQISANSGHGTITHGHCAITDTQRDIQMTSSIEIIWFFKKADLLTPLPIPRLFTS